MTSHIEVARNWIAQSGKSKQGHSMFYDGPTIYSYGRHFPIARIMSNNIVLLTSRSCSISTGKQISQVGSAARRAGFRVFIVDNVLADAQDGNARDLENRATNREAHAKRARINGPRFLAEAHALRNDAATLLAIFGPN